MSIAIQPPSARVVRNSARALRPFSVDAGEVAAGVKVGGNQPRFRQVQHVSLIDDIVSDGLRRAAMAPTYMGALDITGAALLAAAAVARMQVRSNAA
jgi:hypothetical protein